MLMRNEIGSGNYAKKKKEGNNVAIWNMTIFPVGLG